MKIFRFCRKYLLEHKWPMGVYIFMCIGMNLVSIFTPYISGNFIDHLVFSKDMNTIINFCIILTLLSLCRILLGYVTMIIYAKMQIKMGFEFNRDIINRIQNLSFDYLNKNDPAYLSQIINGDTNALISFCLTIIQNFLQNAIMFIIPLIIIVKMNIYITVALFALICIYAIVFFLFRNTIYKINKILSETQNKFFSKLFNQLRFAKFIKAHSIQDEMNRKLNENFIVLKDIMLKAQRIGYLYSGLDGIVTNAAQITLYIIGAIMILRSNFTIGMFTIFAGYFNMIFGSARYFFNFGSSYQGILVSYDRIKDIMSHAIEKKGCVVIDLVHSIEIKNLTFSFDEKLIITKFNYKFVKGKIYGLIGANGSGKSTFINLILGLYYDKKNGEIFYNDCEISDINMHDMRKKTIGITEQETVLFNESLKFNVYFNDSDDEKEKSLTDLLTVVNLQTYVDVHDEKLNYVINDIASNISGGEKQKLGILRTLIKDAQILIFDEPTTAIDINSKESFLSYLREISLSKIIIIVSHDSTVNCFCDEIINF